MPDSINTAIATGAVKQLPSLVARDVDVLSYSTVTRATAALNHASNWRGVIRVFDTARTNSLLAAQFTPRLYTDLFFASMKINSRAASNHANSVFLDLVANGGEQELMAPKAFNFLYVMLCRSGMVEEAQYVHDRCVSNGYYLNRYSYNTFLNACAKSNRIADAFHTLRAMAESQVAPDVVSCNVLISCCVRSDEIVVALSMLERMQQWGIPPDIYSYNSVINGFRKSRMLEEAFDMVACMEIGAGNHPIENRHPEGAERVDNPVCPDLVTYNTLISGIAAHDMPDLVRARVVQTHMEECGLEGNEVTYNALMATAARSDRVEEAFALYDEMISRRLKPNCECYTTLITLCGHSGEVERAFRIHEQMIESGIEPSVVTFNALLTVCRRGNRQHGSDIALEVLELMHKTPGCVPDVITYSTIIDTLGRDGRFHDVRRLLDEMTSSGVQPNLVTYTCMISALSRAGDLDGAMRVFLDMEHDGIEPNVYTFSCLINGAGRRKEVDRSMKILQMMRDRNIRPSEVTYVMLLQMCSRTGDRSRMREALDEIAKDERLAGKAVMRDVEALLESDEVMEAAKSPIILEEAFKMLGAELKSRQGRRTVGRGKHDTGHAEKEFANFSSVESMD